MTETIHSKRKIIQTTMSPCMIPFSKNPFFNFILPYTLLYIL